MHVMSNITDHGAGIRGKRFDPPPGSPPQGGHPPCHGRPAVRLGAQLTGIVVLHELASWTPSLGETITFGRVPSAALPTKEL
jgi:hypothetical protein